jgi:hypothetical protein
MIIIKYPDAKPTIKKVDGIEQIFCIVRKRWFKITPEEWVRQNTLVYLNKVLGYSLKLIAVEKQLHIAEMKKRFDIVVYKNDAPFIIIECKEMNVKLDESTITQVLHYNSKIQAPYVVVTNGNYCRGFFMDVDGFYEIDEIPSV